MQEPEAIIIRLGELTLKGKNRRRFEKKMMEQIANLMKAYPKATTHEEYARVYVVLNGEPYDEIAAGLNRVFGLTSYSPALTAGLDLEDIRRRALEWMRGKTPAPKTFKVSAKRANKAFPHTSQEIGHLVGGYILRQEDGKLAVDVHKPDMEVKIDIRQNEAFVFSDSIPGTGGYPVGSNGRAMLMLSGGIDSPVAGWQSMRRGLEIEGVHFHSYPYTSERAQQKVIDLTRKLARYTSDRIVLHMVPFTEIQTRLNQSRTDSLLITLMRRSMFRITEQLAAERRAGAIVTGESLGQVASQTLPSMQVIGDGIRLPILRPLIMSDKTEIIKQAEAIDTFNLSILPYEDCCTLFVPKSPATSPNLNVVERMEKSLDFLPELEREAVERTEKLFIREHDEDKFDEYF
ncbi:tRNA uracil 4-sulfurtransferase ThiI [Gorillibacterium timonense]|uniref:tRNA uracil 4-sulfurtransferase ThiI n=1 Tax=Gorillibacterium timonense TaxID=1689269 RepID=UPI00071CAAFA|nr:tRNA uracil 4-sulfurtransferase ThiI [Gorillibacterium timonense]